MQIGMIGLGPMGGNMAIRLAKAGHDCVVYDRDSNEVAATAAQGAKSATTLPEFVEMLERPRAVWLMVPAAAVDSVISTLTPLL